MQTRTLLRRNLVYYWRTNLAVVAGVATAVAVLAGALLVGASVRASLRDLVLLRLGSADQVISAAGFYREGLAAALQSHARFGEAFRAACPLIALEGLVIHQQSGRRATGVLVYGVDDRFWKFHAVTVRTLRGREILLSPDLARELESKPGETILVRVEKPSAIPTESLHGRKEDAGRTIRFTAREALAASEMGEFSIRPQQGPVRAVFVHLERLQRELQQEGRVNTILVAEKMQPRPGAMALGEILRGTFALEDLGIHVRALQQCQCLSVESDGALLSDALAETARGAATRLGMRLQPVLSYLANTIRAGGREIPYSLVTATGLAAFGGKGSSPTAIWLNDWAARELGAQPGATVSLDYYVWSSEGRLETRSAHFELRGIVPLAGAAADRDLAPVYPGITDSAKVSDWDPPFPIDLKRVRPRDEQYWDRYRGTPKAFIELAKGQELWGSRFGKLTALRVFAREDQAAEALEPYQQRLRAALDPLAAGMAVHLVKTRALQASRGSTDFGEYFTYFSFFLVSSALLLAGLFFRLGVEQRIREIGFLRAAGFPASKLRVLFLAEGAALASAGALAGAAGAVGYGGLMVLGLRTWWSDAVGTERLALHVTAAPLAFGAAGGLLAAMAAIVWTLRGLAAVTPRGLLAGSTSSGRTRWARVTGALLILAGVVLLMAAWAEGISQTAGFFGAGMALLAAAICYQWVWLVRGGRGLLAGVAGLGWRNAGWRPGRSALSIALIASATFIIVAVDAFRRERGASLLDPTSGSGGYAAVAESLLPVYHDLNSPAGRESLNLPALEDVRFVSFRLQPGDDASCLNLYEPRDPRILAAPQSFIERGGFRFRQSLTRTTEEKANPWLLLKAQPLDGAVPAIADANSMTYVLHRKLGEEFVLDPHGNRPVRLRLVAALADSIFQGELLISEENFLRLFPDQQGYRFFLLEAQREKGPSVSGAIEETLSDYGFDITSTADRLAAYHRVENTYLSTFQALGGLGLLVGTIGLGAVLLRNVLERRRELALLRAVGYRPLHLAMAVIAENALLLAAGLVTGATCALVAIVPALAARGGSFSGSSLGVLLPLVVAAGLAASLLAVRVVVRANLLEGLRAE